MPDIRKGLASIRHLANRVQACNLSTWKAETGGPEAQGNPPVWGEVKAIPDCMRLCLKNTLK